MLRAGDASMLGSGGTGGGCLLPTATAASNPTLAPVPPRVLPAAHALQTHPPTCRRCCRIFWLSCFMWAPALMRFSFSRLHRRDAGPGRQAKQAGSGEVKTGGTARPATERAHRGARGLLGVLAGGSGTVPPGPFPPALCTSAAQALAGQRKPASGAGTGAGTGSSAARAQGCSPAAHPHLRPRSLRE